MKSPTVVLAVALAHTLTAPKLAAAPIPGLFGTGVDDEGELLPPGGEVDTHYELVASPDPAFPGPEAVTLNTGYPVPPWIEEGPNSRWISATQASGNAAPGEYRYRTTFDLTGFDEGAASISGEWATDDGGADIRLNGTSTGITDTNGFTGTTPFVIDSGFVAGVNTLEFVVTNGGAAANPTGLRVTMTGTVLVPDEAPSILVAPIDVLVPDGAPFSLEVVADGTPPLSYQWRRDDVDISGATGDRYDVAMADPADGGSYTVEVSNAFGTVSSAPVAVDIGQVYTGVFNTGVDDDGLPLAGNVVDPHYTLVENANGVGSEAYAMDSIPSPPWVANSANSRWIGPTFDSSGLPGLYTFQTSFDLLGFDPSKFVLSGLWSSDNSAPAVRINGTTTGVTHSGDFAVLSAFRIDSGFVAGINLLEFDVVNAGDTPNPIGLRVEGLEAIGVAVGIPGFRITAVQRDAEGLVSLTWNSLPGATYAAEFSVDAASWLELDDAIDSAGMETSYTDRVNDNSDAIRFYRVLRVD